MSLGTDLCGSSMWMLYFCGILFCCKDSRIQAMCWHKKLALMLTVPSCPMFHSEKSSHSCLVFGVMIHRKYDRT